MTEDEMVGRHHQLKGHEFEQPLGDSERQGSLSCWSPWEKSLVVMMLQILRAQMYYLITHWKLQVHFRPEAQMQCLNFSNTEP